MELLYFAWVRETIGRSQERVTPPDHVATIADLLDWLAADSDTHRAACADRSRRRAAVDQQFVPLDASLADAREVAIFPPVTGG